MSCCSTFDFRLRLVLFSRSFVVRHNTKIDAHRLAAVIRNEKHHSTSKKIARLLVVVVEFNLTKKNEILIIMMSPKVVIETPNLLGTEGAPLRIQQIHIYLIVDKNLEINETWMM